MELKFTYQFDKDGLTAQSSYARHIRDMIEQILLTRPGERVNRPGFGSGLLQAVFEGNNTEMAATSEFLIQGALNQWIGHLIEVERVNVESIDSTLEVSIVYMILKNKERQTARITH